MTDSACWRSSVSYSCFAFVHLGKVSQLLSCGNICSAILLDSSGRHVVSDVLILSGQKAVSQSVNWSSDAFDTSNGRTASTAKPAAEVIYRQQDISDCSVSAWNSDSNVQFMTPMKVVLLKMNAQLAGCITKTLTSSLKFAHGFIKYARHYAWKRAVLSAHNAYCNVAAVSASPESCLRTPSSVDTAPVIMSKEETMQNTVVVHQSVIIVMTAPHRLEIDYQWCYRLCELLVKWLELYDAMNWLSTLGGAYSTLGDYFIYHAEWAAKISLKQLRIALEMGSPPIVIRCHLYFALSLLQTGRLRNARQLIWLQYQQVLRLPILDTQLIAVCQSLWNRLRYLRCRKRCEFAAVKFVEKSLS